MGCTLPLFRNRQQQKTEPTKIVIYTWSLRMESWFYPPPRHFAESILGTDTPPFEPPSIRPSSLDDGPHTQAYPLIIHGSTLCPPSIVVPKAPQKYCAISLSIGCLPGYYELYDYCEECEIGFYQDDYGGRVCTECPLGYVTAQTGSTSVSACTGKDHTAVIACQCAWATESLLRACFIQSMFK